MAKYVQRYDLSTVKIIQDEVQIFVVYLPMVNAQQLIINLQTTGKCWGVFNDLADFHAGIHSFDVRAKVMFNSITRRFTANVGCIGAGAINTTDTKSAQQLIDG
jgi:hypothetical protein